MRTGHAMTVASISRASMAGKSTIYKVAITITAGNVVVYSTSKSRKSSTWRPSIGTAKRTITTITWASNEN
jgi:hypothetical protein